MYYHDARCSCFSVAFVSGDDGDDDAHDHHNIALNNLAIEKHM